MLSDSDMAVLSSLLSIWCWYMTRMWLPVAAVVHAVMLWLIFRERAKTTPGPDTTKEVS